MKGKGGRLFVISAPSGTGKTTVCRRLEASDPSFVRSISYTTRKPRAGEQEGRDYHFVDGHRFQQMIDAGDLLEWAEIHGERYGTGKRRVEEELCRGRTILLAIDVEGASQIKAARRDAVLIFLLPPSLEALRRRLLSRGTEGEEALARRLDAARSELRAMDWYDHRILNERLENAVSDILAIAEGKEPRGACGAEEAARIRERF